jgi:hypothetical protein
MPLTYVSSTPHPKSKHLPNGDDEEEERRRFFPL